MTNDEVKKYYLYELKMDIAGAREPKYYYIGKTSNIEQRLKNHTGIFREDSNLYFPNRKSAKLLKGVSAKIRVASIQQVWYLNFDECTNEDNPEKCMESKSCLAENEKVKELIEKEEKKEQKKNIQKRYIAEGRI